MPKKSEKKTEKKIQMGKRIRTKKSNPDQKEKRKENKNRSGKQSFLIREKGPAGEGFPEQSTDPRGPRVKFRTRGGEKLGKNTKKPTRCLKKKHGWRADPDLCHGQQERG